MVKPMTTNMFGLLEVKITARVRKRGFTPWKAWKKQWCNLKKSISGLELTIYNTVPIQGVTSIPVQTVLIPETCICCRTDSRTKSFAFGLFVDSKCRKAVMYLAGFSETNSQEWIQAIRRALDKRQNSVINIPEAHISYTISLIDNAHSRAAGLFGVYGEMTVTSAGLIIHQPNGKNKSEENLDRLCIGWNQILQFHLSDKRGGEDERRICIIHTNELFPNGPGQLRIFCIEAPKLLHAIMTQCNKILTTKLSTSPKQICDKDLTHSTENNEFPSLEKVSDVSLRCTHDEYSANKSTISPCHRMSRSEGDLCGYCDSDRDSGWSSGSPPEYNSILSSAYQQTLTENNIRLSISSDDSSLVLKGKSADSLIFTGLLLNSAVNSKTDVFETNELVHSLPDITELIDHRRVSGVSVASGVYEEISENSAHSISKPPPLYEEPVYMPPPLPPRGRYASHTSGSDDGLDDEDWDCSTPVTAKSLHSHFYNWEFEQQSEVLSNSSPDVNVIQDATVRKLSASSLHSGHDLDYENSKCNVGSPTFSRSHFSRRCYSNEVRGMKNKDLAVIPRCNTEPQQSLRPTQLCSPDVTSNLTINRKNKSRFDLTPIKNKLNSFIKSHLDTDSSPKSRSNFYNSLPRSMKINKHTRKTPLKAKIHKDCTRSCELLDCDAINQGVTENIARSCELLDCVNSPSNFVERGKAKSRDEIYEECNLKQKPNEMNLKYNSLQEESLSTETYSNCDILQLPPKDITKEPNFTQMRNEWIEHKKANLGESDYVPMSPGIPTSICEENDDYMDMTGSKGTSIISSTIINESLKLDHGQI